MSDWVDTNKRARANSKEVLQRIAGSPVPRRGLRAISQIRRSASATDPERLYRIGKRLRYSPGAAFDYQRGGSTTIRLRLAGAALSLYYLDDYEPTTLGPVVALARSARGFLDIGAQAGVYSLVVASANPAVRTIAFEADPASLEVLLDNVEFNVGRPDVGEVTVCQAAVSDAVGIAQFNLAGGNSSLNLDFRARSRPIICQTITIDSFLTEYDADLPIDLVKIDTESTEPAVLRGMQNTIERWRPVIAVEVLVGRTEVELNQFIDEQRYRALWLVAPEPRLVDQIAGDDTHHDLNYLLVPAEKLDAVLSTVGGK